MVQTTVSTLIRMHLLFLIFVKAQWAYYLNQYLFANSHFMAKPSVLTLIRIYLHFAAVSWQIPVSLL